MFFKKCGATVKSKAIILFIVAAVIILVILFASGIIGGSRDTGGSVTSKEAEDLVRKYIQANYPGYTENASSHIEYDHDDFANGEEVYVIHVYEVVVDHTATLGWIGVGKQTGNLYDMLSSDGSSEPKKLS